MLSRKRLGIKAPLQDQLKQQEKVFRNPSFLGRDGVAAVSVGGFLIVVQVLAEHLKVIIGNSRKG